MKFRRTLFSLLMCLVLSSCTMQVSSTIQPDGSNDLRIEMGFSATDKEMMGSMGSSTADVCSEMEMDSDLPAGTTFTSEERGDETWCIMTIHYGSLEELRTMLEEGDGITVNRLEILDGKFYYDLSVDMSTEQFSIGDTFPMALKWQVTVPGRVGENNADKVEDKTLTWELPVGEIANIQVESSLSGGGLPEWISWLVPVLMCLCCFGFMVVAGVVIFVLVRRRKGITPVKNDGEQVFGQESNGLPPPDTSTEQN